MGIFSRLADIFKREAKRQTKRIKKRKQENPEILRQRRVKKNSTDFWGEYQEYCPSGCSFFDVHGYRIMALNRENAVRKFNRYINLGLMPADIKHTWPHNTFR